MINLFRDLGALKKLNLSGLNTKKVTRMEDMFKGCKSLEELDLSNFDTRNVINMKGMFDGCTSLKDLPDLSKWDKIEFKKGELLEECFKKKIIDKKI